MAKTLLDKIWDSHLVNRQAERPDLLYVDLHLVHEVTSPQAFEGIRLAGRTVRRPDLTMATVDHAVPTEGRARPWADALAVEQVATLRRNCAEHGVQLFDVDDERQGIVHVVAPEQGLTQPGMIIVCGDSHTSTHGAFGALAFGIGTSEVEHVLATQTIPRPRPRNLSVRLDGLPTAGVGAKDAILAAIASLGTAGGAGSVIEYRGSFIDALSMEGRMTVCNMSIEAGARAGLVAPDDTTIAYLEGRPHAPTGPTWDEAVARWRTLTTDPDAAFDAEVFIDLTSLAPRITWGTTPSQNVGVTDRVPDPTGDLEQSALEYMDLRPGTRMDDVEVDRVFIGSCTNGRIEDMRAAAQVAAGRRVASHVEAMVVPGSGQVKAQAEAEGLHRIFREAGFDWREPGCSMCLAMNPDRLEPGQRCASTSNRNFQGRQGPGGRTHLLSPASAAAAAITGHFVDVREVMQ